MKLLEAGPAGRGRRAGDRVVVGGDGLGTQPDAAAQAWEDQ
jgi:hypothetical protein